MIRSNEMKIKYLVCVIVLLFALSSVAAPPAGRLPMAYKGSAAMRVDNTTYIDANRILMFVTNHGNFGRDLSDLFGYDYGTWFPYTGDTADIGGNIDKAGDFSPYYAGGLWIGAIDSASDSALVIISEYSDEYVPGPMVGGTFQEDGPAFKVYKLFRDSLANNPNQAYLDYLANAIGQGAPYLVTNEGDTIPDMIGDQMCWSVFNDADPDQHVNDAGWTSPLGIEVRNTTFAFDRQGSLGNIVIIRLHVFNKGNRVLKNCYFSIWSDPDLGSAGDDLVGCDTTLGLGYVYNDSNNDSQYGEAPPALGIDFFQGPLVAGNPTDTAFMWGDTIPGFRNLGMTSFNKYINGTDPDNNDETYYYMRGLNRDGTNYIYNGQVLKFVHTGNPVTESGDLDIAPADRRWMQSTGPITFRPGDSTEILAAIIVGQGNNNLNSITVVKQLDDFAQQLYENGFNPPKPPARPVVSLTKLHKELVLTWTDVSETDPGDFDFEGYSVWQGTSASGPWTLVKTWDVINDYDKALVDSLTDLETGLVLPDIKRAVKNTGLAYSYTIDKDALLNEDLKDVTTYYFRVTAFSFGYYYNGKLVPNQDRFLESQTIVRAQPQAAPAGINFSNNPHDMLEVTHATGASDGYLEPIVTDPWALTGDSYLVDFGLDTVVEVDEYTDDYYTVDTTIGPDTCDADWDVTGDSIIVYLCEYYDSTLDSSIFHSDTTTVISTFWNAYNTTTNDTLVQRNFNLSGDDAYQIYDGFQLKVIGPPLAGKRYTYAGADPPNLSPVAVAEQDYEGGRWITGGNHGGEIFFGGVFMEPNFWGPTSLDPMIDYPVMEVHFRPMASYTDLNGDGVYTIGEPYVVDDPSETQNAFMYQTFSGGAYLGFNPVPFTVWDVTDPDNPRQVNVVVRDRDQNGQWDLNYAPLVPDPLLPNNGDMQYNYCWLLNTDYDPTGTYYGDGTGGSIDFWSYANGNGVWDAAWCLWVNDRGTGGMLAEESYFTLYPNIVIKADDSYTFSSEANTKSYSESELDAIKAVPNPFYMVGPYDPSPGSYQVCFHHLPEKCNIEIYNLGGDLIRTLEKDDPTTAIACWDILTEQGLPVSSGIYIYVVNAEGFGTKIGKMAVFVQEEVLNIY
ncbi:MAG: hypothetical protein CVT49_07940 [candidate division Zixibacteria bacterium HGW-Zixibacteria-1]|nr:MAG: hypothetical protein CVT49_07940 [candidate division Zixibacteria bacterium HGW-Zixibacteria-1]